jgi:ACS family hexuronate transporter-like MFS transporter
VAGLSRPDYTGRTLAGEDAPTAMDADKLPARGSAWKWWICGLLMLATMINYMDRLTVNLTAPRIKADLLLSNEQYGQVEGVFGLAFAAGALLFGWSADRWNVRGLYALALFAWSAAGVSTGLAGTFALLLASRFALGLFEAGNWPCALRTTQRILTPRERTLGNSILQSGAAVGAILIPQLVAFLLVGPGRPWMSAWFGRHFEPFRPEQVSIFGLAPGAGFPGTLPWAGLFLGVVDHGAWRYPFFVVGGLGTVWVALWLLSLRRQDLALPTHTDAGPRRAAEGELSLAAVFLNRRFVVLVVVVICINLTWHFFRAWLPILLQEWYGYREEDVSTFLSLYYVATDLGSLSAGFASVWLVRLGLRVHGSRVLVFFTFALLTLLSAVVAFLPRGPLLFGLFLVLGFGALGVFPVYYSLSQDLTVRYQGKLTGTLGCSTWLASAVMHPLVGRWIDRTHDYATAVAVAGVFPMIGLVTLVLLWGRERGSA